MLSPLATHPTNSLFRIGVLLLLLLLCGLSCHALQHKLNRHFLRAQSKKDKVAKDTKLKVDKSKNSCSVTGGRDKPHLLSRHPRDVNTDWSERRRSKFGNAVYFSGRQVLKLTPAHKNFATHIPMKQFTAELWVRPEGGQSDPVTFLDLHDSCDGEMASGVWSLGLKTFHENRESDARVFFSLNSQMTANRTVIYTHKQYHPNKWFHVVVSYDGETMILYLNGAKVTVSKEQRGDVFNSPSIMCKDIHLGGNLISGHFFRGTIDEFRLWNYPLQHVDVVNNIFNADLPLSKPEGLVFHDEFKDVTKWTLIAGRSLEIIHSDIPYQSHGISVKPPPCGRTVCDDPDVIRSYTNNPQLRGEKVVRYKIVNLMDEHGLNPVVTSEQIFIQHKALNAAFEPYNITFELYVENIRNTSLRKRMIMVGCEPSLVGDGQCHTECQHAVTGNDGGDCDAVKVLCPPHKKGNGKCDFECNKAYHDWDLGDCCLPGPETHYTCYNHTSPLKGFVGIDEYRDAIQVSASSHLNVFLASTTTDDVIGLATFPWETHVFTWQGGTVVQPETFGRPGQTDSLVHEIGHIFGLWHVHHGVSEIPCDDPCVETFPSMEHGDMCADTAPTPQNLHCHDPDPLEDKCGLLSSYTGTPYNNYMSYADDNCTNEFSPNQVARMHCYLDLVYKPWTTSNIPSPIPLPPRVISSDTSSATVAWVPSFSLGSNDIGTICGMCTDDGAIFQFADSASSPAPQDISGEWHPMQATGPPDAINCDASTRVWMPKVNKCSERLCQLDLRLRWPVKPASLTVWVTWYAHRSMSRIRLYYEDGSVDTLTEVDAYCDVPFTARLAGDRKLSWIRIYTRSPNAAIDAIEVLSQPMNELCGMCPPINYKVSRSPPFSDSVRHFTTDLSFIDTDVVYQKTYNYWVTAMYGNWTSYSSPALVYTHGDHFCGDGRVDSQSLEECDDKNAVDGDGCNMECQVEEFFRCTGSPSQCYRHDGDGVCEDFEVRTSVVDCGFYTPPGFTDQWADEARANPVFQLSGCPESNLLGVPDPIQECTKFGGSSRAWSPCGSSFMDGNFWIEVYFADPVVATEILVYIGSDGRSEHDPSPKNISVELIKVSNHTSTLPLPVTLDCAKSVTSIPISHDLSQSFFHTKGVRINFQSYNISLRAVKLRSTTLLDPVVIASCDVNEVYNPRSGICVRQNCSTRCSYLRMKHSKLHCSGDHEGDTCKLGCKNGYRLKGDTDKALCASGQWITSSPVACVPVDCAIPNIPFATAHCPLGTTYRNTCNFTCNKPARLQGFGTLITCKSNGLWSAPMASCHVRCPPPLQVPHAKMVSKSCKRGRKPINTSCRFKCKKRFHVENQKYKKRVFHLTCGVDGTWKGLRCVRLQCPPIPKSLAGLYKCKNKAYPGSRCSLKCKGSRESRQNIFCKSNGVWSREFKPCHSFSKAQCRPPSHLKHLRLTCARSRHGFGSTCGIACTFPHKEPIYTGTHTRGKPPTHPPPVGQVITNITCTGSSHWYPHPASLRCVDKCIINSMLDGWCDGINNREHCRWDRGDCCASTLKGKVTPFSSNCTTQCECKDPGAQENKSRWKPGRKRKRGQ